MFKFKIGDEVIVTTGRDKAKKGKVQKVWQKENKLTISGVNIYKRHKKATRNQGAGIFEVNRPMDVANVQIICPKCGKPTTVAFQIKGKIKERVCKKCKGTIMVERNKK